MMWINYSHTDQLQLISFLAHSLFSFHIHFSWFLFCHFIISTSFECKIMEVRVVCLWFELFIDACVCVSDLWKMFRKSKAYNYRLRRIFCFSTCFCCFCRHRFKSMKWKSTRCWRCLVTCVHLIIKCRSTHPRFIELEQDNCVLNMPWSEQTKRRLLQVNDS